MEMSRQYASFIRFLNGTTMSSRPSSRLSIWSLTAMKRTPRAGNSLSMYLPESIYSRPKRDKSFTTTQSTMPLFISSIISLNWGRSKLEPEYPSSTRSDTISISSLSLKKSLIRDFWLDMLLLSFLPASATSPSSFDSLT